MARLLPGVAVILMLTTTAFAGIPDADLSTVSIDDDCLYYCPQGDGQSGIVTVTALNAAGNPLPGIQAADIHFNVGGAPVLVTPIDTETDAAGQFDASYDMTSGDCATYTLTVTIYTVTLSTTVDVRLRDVDMNHLGCVDGTDGAMFGLEWNTAGPCADFDCNGVVEGIDGAIFGLHWAHGTCPE